MKSTSTNQIGHKTFQNLIEMKENKGLIYSVRLVYIQDQGQQHDVI